MGLSVGHVPWSLLCCPCRDPRERSHPHVPSHPALSPDWQVTRQLQDTSREQVAERGRFSQEVRVRDQSLEQMQKEMLERARAHRDAHTYTAHNMEEMKDIADNKPGFIKAMWCGCQECEDALKEEVGVTSRCMPFEQEHVSDTCVYCGKPAKKLVYWGKAY